MHFHDPTLSPPGGWKYTQPQSGLTMRGITFGALLKQVAQHRANMGYPTEGRLSEEIEDAICQSLSFEDQTIHCSNGFRPPKPVHWTEVKNFLKTAASWFTTGRQLVPVDEANRRAGICLNCPYNVGTSGCGGCAAALSELRTVLSDRVSPAGLQACGICGCDNATQIHVPLENLRAGTGHLKYPDFCWKGDDSTNFDAAN